ncbi:hypothetical protein JHK82_018356 [Glycine max]|nr:hypothetical protein JHK85_018786 [Glycine max]KAG5037540.1 hypothetical protein JHK86_018380 [Glycine max]KAG5142661.1 hypothetical protein JHK82_018356 [Glycine max]
MASAHTTSLVELTTASNLLIKLILLPPRHLRPCSLPRRRSCVVRPRSTLSDLFTRDDTRKTKHSHSTCTKPSQHVRKEVLERREGVGEEGEIVVSEGHSFEVEFVEGGVVILGECGDPGGEGHEVEVNEAWLALDGHGPDAGESAGGATGGYGVAVSDEELCAGEGLGAVAGHADQ